MGQTRSSCHSAVPFSWKSMCRKSGLRAVEMAWAHVFWVALQGGESVFVKMQAGGAVFVSCCPDLVRWSGQCEFMHRLVKCDFGSGLVHFRRFPPEDLVSPGRLACTCGGRRRAGDRVVAGRGVGRRPAGQGCSTVRVGARPGGAWQGAHACSSPVSGGSQKALQRHI